MSIPGYDDWKLRGPDEDRSVIMEACETCKGVGQVIEDDFPQDCPDCDGTGEVEATLDEPDGDYEYERRRDAAMDD